MIESVSIKAYSCDEKKIGEALGAEHWESATCARHNECSSKVTALFLQWRASSNDVFLHQNIPLWQRTDFGIVTLTLHESGGHVPLVSLCRLHLLEVASSQSTAPKASLTFSQSRVFDWERSPVSQWHPRLFSHVRRLAELGFCAGAGLVQGALLAYTSNKASASSLLRCSALLGDYFAHPSFPSLLLNRPPLRPQLGREVRYGSPPSASLPRRRLLLQREQEPAVVPRSDHMDPTQQIQPAEADETDSVRGERGSRDVQWQRRRPESVLAGSRSVPSNRTIRAQTGELGKAKWLNNNLGQR